MGGWLGVGSSGAKTDRGNQLAGISAAWGDKATADNAYTKGIEAGTTNTDKGLGTLDQIKNFWMNRVSGNRTALQGAAAPVINNVVGQADAAKTQQANLGTSRGGGANAGNQQLQQQVMGQENKAIADVQPEAAKEVSQIGTTQANIGQGQMAKALQALGLSAETTREITDSSAKSRELSATANADVRQQWSDLLTGLGI